MKKAFCIAVLALLFPACTQEVRDVSKPEPNFPEVIDLGHIPETPEELSQALIDAAGSGDIEKAREYLTKAADINAWSSHDRTALMEATRAGNTQITRLLIEMKMGIRPFSMPLQTALRTSSGCLWRREQASMR